MERRSVIQKPSTITSPSPDATIFTTLFLHVSAQRLLLGALGASADIELDGSEGLLVAADGRLERHHQPLGGEEIRRDSLAHLDLLRPGGEWLHVEPEIED